MKRNFILLGVMLVCLILLSAHSAMALRFDFDSDKEIEDWELGPNATAKVQDGKLELTVGAQDSGIYFGDAKWTDYTLEVHARKKEGTPYFHLFTRTQKPAIDFYFMEISYNSHTTSVYVFRGGVSEEITGGPRPARPKSKDTKGGDAYTIVFEVKGDTLKTFIDGN